MTRAALDAAIERLRNEDFTELERALDGKPARGAGVLIEKWLRDRLSRASR